MHHQSSANPRETHPVKVRIQPQSLIHPRLQSPVINFPKNLAFRTILAYTFPIGTHGRRKFHDPTPFTNRPARTHPPPPLRRPLRAPRLALWRRRLHRRELRPSQILAPGADEDAGGNLRDPHRRLRGDGQPVLYPDEDGCKGRFWEGRFKIRRPAEAVGGEPQTELPFALDAPVAQAPRSGR